MVLPYQGLVCTELKCNLQYYSLIESTQLLCSRFPFYVEGEDGARYFHAYIGCREFFSVRTNVSMGDLVVAIPLFSVASFILLPSCICVHISQLGRVCPLCVSSS